MGRNSGGMTQYDTDLLPIKGVANTFFGVTGMGCNHASKSVITHNILNKGSNGVVQEADKCRKKVIAAFGISCVVHNILWQTQIYSLYITVSGMGKCGVQNMSH